MQFIFQKVSAHLYSCFRQIYFRCQSFPRENVRIMSPFKFWNKIWKRIFSMGYETYCCNWIMCKLLGWMLLFVQLDVTLKYEFLVNSNAPFSSASICSWVNDVRFLCSFLFSWSRICVSSESSPFELMELVFSPAPSCGWQPSVNKSMNKYELACLLHLQKACVNILFISFYSSESKLRKITCHPRNSP